MADPALDEAADREVARRVSEELSRRRLSRQAPADLARISLSTLEKALAGTRPFTLASTIRIEQALGLALRPGAVKPSASETAPESMGAYAHSAVTWLEGRYVTLRPSFGTPGGIYAYLTTVRADGHRPSRLCRNPSARIRASPNPAMSRCRTSRAVWGWR